MTASQLIAEAASRGLTIRQYDATHLIVEPVEKLYEDQKFRDQLKARKFELLAYLRGEEMRREVALWNTSRQIIDGEFSGLERIPAAALVGQLLKSSHQICQRAATHLIHNNVGVTKTNGEQK